MRTAHEQTPPKTRRGRAVIVGIGTNDADGHVRYTRGDSWELFGGSQEVHEQMQKNALRIRSELDRLGITPTNMTYEQYQQVVAIVNRVNANPD